MKIIILVLTLLTLGGMVKAESEFSQENIIRAIIGEAGNQGYEGMVHLASGVLNRGTLRGVYGFKAKHVDSEPDWVWKMAEKAYLEAKKERSHDGDHWGSKIVDKKWIKRMEELGYELTCDYKDHVFYKGR